MSKNSNGCSSSVPIIVVKHAAETFPSADPAFGQTDLVSGFDDLPAAPLMVPLFVIVDEILVHDMPKVVLSKEHQPVNRLALERTIEPLQIQRCSSARSAMCGPVELRLQPTNAESSHETPHLGP